MSCEKTSSATSKSLFSNLFGSVSLLKRVVSNNNEIPDLKVKDEDKFFKHDSEKDESVCNNEDPRIDLLFRTVQGITTEYLESLLEECWEISPRDTLRIMFYVRDCRGGKGRKQIFYDFMVWLWGKDKTLFEKNIPCVPFYGCFKDLRKIMEIGKERYRKNGWTLDPSFEKTIISYWCNVLAKDVECLNQNESVSLAAKWVPIQDGRFCKEMKLSHKLFRRMIRLLRDRLDIVECKMSLGEWDKIQFEKVCYLSMKNYSKAFERHCTTRFTEYLETVNKENTKVNDKQLYPSDIAGPYLKHLDEKMPNETDDLAWEDLLKKCRNSLSDKKILCVVDTSGSMNGRALQVAVSLGLFMSELYPESKFYRKFVTFSTEPKLQEVYGNNLCERVRNLQKAEWSMSTNLQKIFELVLENSTTEDHPDSVLILTDSNFDHACQTQTNHLQWNIEDSNDMKDTSSTFLKEVERKYREKGIKRPKIIFWDLFWKTLDFPTTNVVKDCVWISGYSSIIMKTLLEERDVSPLSLVNETINKPRYDLVYTNENM
jgi:hypothetical protein